MKSLQNALNSYVTNSPSLFRLCQYKDEHGPNSMPLSNWMSINHPSYNMSSWCFYGTLMNDEGVVVADVSTMVQQQQGMNSTPYLAEWSLCTDKNSGYVITPYMIHSDLVSYAQPFSINISVPGIPDKLTIELLQGQTGERGAIYHLRGQDLAIGTQKLKGTGEYYYDVLLEDVFGTIQAGYGPNSFLPQYLTSEQNDTLQSKYDEQMDLYLKNHPDECIGQGSYYYSAPLLKVLSYEIKDLSNNVVLSGKQGWIWEDYVVQGFTPTILNALSNDAKWQFYAIQLPEIKACIMISVVQFNESKLNGVTTAAMYSLDSVSKQAARTPLIQWTSDEVKMEPNCLVPRSATEPKPDTDSFTLTLTYKEPDDDTRYVTTITGKTTLPNQEIQIDSNEKSVFDKFEGSYTVSAKIHHPNLQPTPLNTSGIAWAEINLLNND
ncbi:hypothetical protein [Vibrio nitrifigilis]|uniref:Uncharacterized protein n=1 Tax=Vibrio nitrifigilis TaxID=2789781 RepID=A0ABS0GI35_9VIBR|nr:hypothetical protein [Vibrio nitrifigilis]MBF9002091.1 hypothetical protein [Vibrio nitrifigilis]